MLVGATPLRSQGDVSCAEVPSRWALRHTERNAPWPAPRSLVLQRLLTEVSLWDRHCSELSAGQVRPALALANPGQMSAYPNRSKSLLHSGARRTCRESVTCGCTGTDACGCNTSALIPGLPLSSSAVFGANSLPRASSNKLPFHRSLVVRLFCLSKHACCDNKDCVRSLHWS